MERLAIVISEQAAAERDPLWLDLTGVTLLSLTALAVAVVGMRILLGVWGVW